jgi:nucleotide-binding universal stress UspA family protein
MMVVLLATDDSIESQQAMEWVQALALPEDSTVFTLAVATLVDLPRASQSVAALRESLRSVARQRAKSGRSGQFGCFTPHHQFVNSSQPLLPKTSVILLHVRQDDAAGLNQPTTAERAMADTVTDLAKRNCSVKRMVVRGGAAGEIVRVSHERNVDLIVLGARRLRTLGRLLLGSVSEAVLHRAGRPVIIARAGDSDA